ncbi:inositol monophosphatase family protein [Streptococcus sp. 121]|uniref:inositol monophosphatase family protein n=1 Tax=Streptococcus sp. 121 TaxID=2797637 RepID=UPI001F3943E8
MEKLNWRSAASNIEGHSSASQSLKEQVQARFELAQDLVREAGEFVKKELAQPLEVACKSDRTDLVTNLDLAVQDILIKGISQVFPEDTFLAEELAEQADVFSGAVWVLDPIDGTNNLVAQQENFAIMLAFFNHGQPGFAFIYDVMGQILLSGGGVLPVTCNGQPFEGQAACVRVNQSLVAGNSAMLRDNAFGLADIARDSLGVRVYGSAGISFLKVLQGKLLTYASYLQPWDYAAAYVLAPALGYRFLEAQGQALRFEGKQPVFLVPQHLEDYFLEKIRGGGRDAFSGRI